MTKTMIFPVLVLMGCKTGVNLFTVEDDIELGAQLETEINNDPATYPVIARADAPEAYAALDRITDRILAADAIELRERLVWEFKIIDDDETVNAFAAPGGYIWIYTGLIDTLENEDSFAGVIAHEIGHADGRHSTEALTQAYGVDLLLGILLDDGGGVVGDIAQGLASLDFSRANERDADERSVSYLCDTPYAADSVALFFEDLGEAQGPAFLSTHPAPANRVRDVRAEAERRDCSTQLSGLDDFATMQAALGLDGARPEAERGE